MPGTDARVASEGKVQPCTPNALAQELGALLQRLGVTAVIADGSGNRLAVAGEPRVIPENASTVPGRRVEVRLCGHTLQVTMAPIEVRRSELDLTPRQRAVIDLISDGLHNREIGERLGISLHTVRRHVEAVLHRLNVPTRAAAAALMQQLAAPARPARTRRVA